MSAYRIRLSGTDWQNWANQLLTLHYGPTEYQKVPDKHKGDAGIEGFTVSSGHAYQAYGCEEPVQVAVRYASQRDKMTEDIGKFIENKSRLSNIFGATKISRWVLFVPLHDSGELVAHASKKTDEVIAERLTYVGDSFRVMVCDEADFKTEAESLMGSITHALDIAAADATPEQIEAWIDDHDPLVESLDAKLKKLPTLTTLDQRIAFRARVLKWYLEGQDILKLLRKYPESYERVVKAKSIRENYLAASTLVSSAEPGSVLQNAISQFKETVKQQANELSPASQEALAHEAASDWLLRCPLDFPERPINA